MDMVKPLGQITSTIKQTSSSCSLNAVFFSAYLSDVLRWQKHGHICACGLQEMPQQGFQPLWCKQWAGQWGSMLDTHFVYTFIKDHWHHWLLTLYVPQGPIHGMWCSSKVARCSYKDDLNHLLKTVAIAYGANLFRNRWGDWEQSGKTDWGQWTTSSTSQIILRSTLSNICINDTAGGMPN